MLLEKYEPQSSGSIFSSQVSTTDQQSGRPSITKLPRIPNTPSIQNSSQNIDLLPSQSRPTVFIPNIERASPLFLLENPIGRGPKIYTKNLPDVFTSGSTVNRNKKFHGIKERNQADDAEQSSLHIGTPTVSTKKTHGQPLISPARMGQYPSIKGGRKTNDPFDVHPASMKENIEEYSLKFGNLSPKKDVKLLKNERTGMSPFRRRNNKIRIRTNIEYGSVFDTNSNIVKNNDGIKEEDMKKQAKKVVVVKKSNTSDSRFFDENNEEVKIKLIDKSAILGSIPILQLNELITIKKVKTTVRNGVIKRMLHVPSFKMFDVLEESTSDISSKENNDIKAWITNWRNSFQRSQRISKIYSCFWNSPEGCVSVVCEPARNGFLTDVIDQHGSLPEKALQSVGKNLLEGISEMHSKIFKPHGNITPRDILVGSKGSLKITPAISTMFPNGQKVEQKSPRATEGILFRPSIRSQQPGLLDARPWSSLSSAVDLSQDIFDFGFTLLQCALGDFSVFDMNSPISLENIKPILANIALQRKPDACCLLHSEDFVRKMLATSNASASSSRRRLTNSNFGRKRNKLIEDLENSFHSDTPYVSLLEALVSINHFSEGFVDLLCSCLRFDREQRPKADELLEHKFFSEAYQVKGPLVTFQELVGLGSKSAGNVENENETGLNKLAEALRMVLLNRNVKDKFDLIMQRRGKNQIDDKAVMELAGELGVSYPKLKKKLNECLLDLQV